jgi:ferredoxin
MITIYCFSGSGHSFAVSKELSQLLDCEIKPIDNKATTEDTAVVVFSVYCQNIPKPVKRFLKGLEAKYVALIATYGKISYGNVLYEAKKLLHGQVIAGAYIPMGHTFLDGDCRFDATKLLPIVRRIKAPQQATIPKTAKNPLANIFPGLRSRIGVKIIKRNNCNSCGLCERTCPIGAIQNGRIHSQCIRCLHCVTICPQKALQYKNSRVLDAYLNSYCKEEYVLYL